VRMAEMSLPLHAAQGAPAAELVLQR